MKKLAFLAAIALCGVFSTHAMAGTIKPIYAVDKDSMKSFCTNSEGQYYETEGGGYGCHAKGGKTTKECGNDGKCVHISNDELVVPKSNKKPFALPTGGLLRDSGPGLPGNNPSQTGAPIAPSAPAARIL